MLLLLGLWGVALLAATAGGLVVGARPGIAEAGLLHAATLAVLVVLWSLPWRRFVVATVAVSALLGLLVGLTSAPTGPPPGRPALPVPGLS
jgi:hypothetical protein